VFGRFNFTEARNLFEDLSESIRSALILRDSLSPSEFKLVLASDFSVSGNIFSGLRSSFDEAIALIRFLNADLREIGISGRRRCGGWQVEANVLLPYPVDLSQAESDVLRTFLSDLLTCSSISYMTRFIFQRYTIKSSLYKNVNLFLRCFPISMISKFMNE
jgi:hypothetical protein